MLEITFLSHPQPRDSGDYLHRVLWPGKALGKYAVVRSIQSSHPDCLKTIINTDILIIKMVVDNDLLAIIKKRSGSGKITVYEISDDFESFPKSLPAYAFYARKDIQLLIRTLASTSTAIQFSSSFLHQKYHYLNQKSAIFFNQCDKIPPLQPSKKGKVTVGWAGSTGHRADVEELARILKRWDNIQKVNIIVMAHQSLVDVFKRHGIKIKSESPGSMQKYLRFLSKLDVGIAMIDENDFSKGRSDGKFLEYASQGVVAVCQNSASYAETIIDGETGFLFGDADSLLIILNQLLQSNELRSKIRENAYKYLCDNRTHKYGAIHRLEFYKELLIDINLATTTSMQDVGFQELIHPIESQLLEAMLLHQNQHLEAALKIYMSLLEVTPEFHVIWSRLRDLYQSIDSKEQVDICNKEVNRLTAQYE